MPPRKRRRRSASGEVGMSEEKAAVNAMQLEHVPAGVYEGLPTEQIAALAANYDQVNLRIVRTNPQGRWASVGLSDCIMDTKDMVVLEEKINNHCGGGTYLVEVRDARNRLQTIMQKFRLNIQGPPRPPGTGLHGPPVFYGAQPAPASPNPFAPPLPSHPMMAHAQPMASNPEGTRLFGMPANESPPSETFQPFGANVNPENAYPPQNAIPPHIRGMLPADQWAYYYSMQRQQPLSPAGTPPGASMYSDQVAMYSAQQIERELAAERAKNAKLEERLDALAKRQEALIEEERKARERAEREAQAAAHRAELAALEGRIAALAESKNSKKETSIEDWAKILVPLAPVMSAFISTKKDEAKIESDRELKRFELTQAQSQQMIAALMGKKDDSMAVMLPFLLKMMENNSPQARAEASATVTETQMMLMKMISDMVREQNSGPETPWWYPMVQNVLEGIQGTVAMAQYQKASQPQQPAALPAPQPIYTPPPIYTPAPAQAQQPQTQEIVPYQPQPYASQTQAYQPAAPLPSVPPPAQAAQEAYEDEEDEEGYPGPDPRPIELQWDNPDWAFYTRKNSVAANLTKLIYANLPPEFAAFRTNEWRHIIFSLHANEMPAHLGHVIAEYVTYLVEVEALPTVLVEQNILNTPEHALSTVVSVLPVANAQPDYAREVIAAASAEIRAYVESLDEEDEGEGDEEGEEEDTTASEASSTRYAVVAFPVDGKGEEVMEQASTTQVAAQ